MTCIAGSQDCIGNVALADRAVSFNQQISSITPNTGSDYRFLYSQFWTTKALVQRWSTKSMKGLVSKRHLEATPIPFPPMEMQVQFGQWFERWHHIRELTAQANSLEDHLFNSLAHQAFRGEL